MSIRKMTLAGFIEEVRQVSRGPYSRKFCFVLGAGASRSSGIPTGQKFVNDWDQELRIRDPEGYEKWRRELGIPEENKFSFYGQYYDKRFERDQGGFSHDGHNYLINSMENAKASVGYVSLAMILQNTEHNVVITTNFDHLVEDTVTRFGPELPLVIGHEVLAFSLPKQLKKPTIIKIHRDLLLEPINDSAHLAHLSKKWEPALEKILSEYHLVFIGYAGNDNSVMEFLNQNIEKFKNREWRFPYWLVYRKDEPDARVIKFLEDSEAYMIRHNGFDEVMVKMAKALGCEMPTRKEFLRPIIEQYDEWIKAANAILPNENVPDDGTPPPSGTPPQSGGASKKSDEPVDPDSTFFNAVMDYQVGNYEEAVQKMQTVTREVPNNAQYYNQLSSMLHNIGRYDEAEEEARKAIHLEPHNSCYHYNLGVILHEKGQYIDAAQEKQKAIYLRRDIAEYYYSLGITLHAMKEYADAEKEKRKAVCLEPDVAKYHYSLGITLHFMERYDEALLEKREAVRLEPNNVEYQNSIAVTLHCIFQCSGASLESGM